MFSLIIKNLKYYFYPFFWYDNIWPCYFPFSVFVTKKVKYLIMCELLDWVNILLNISVGRTEVSYGNYFEHVTVLTFQFEKRKKKHTALDY